MLFYVHSKINVLWDAEAYLHVAGEPPGRFERQSVPLKFAEIHEAASAEENVPDLTSVAESQSQLY